MPRSSRLRVRRSNRRGNVLILMLIAVVPIFAMAALAIDFGLICNARAEIQRSADSAAMAGVWELYESRRPESAITPEEAAERARMAVIEYGRFNAVAGQASRIDEVDIEVGYLANPSDPSANLDTSDPSQFNAVRVRVHRKSGGNGGIGLYISRMLGNETVDMEGESTAVFVSDIAGFQTPGDGVPLPLIPFALDIETWSVAVSGMGTDAWKWDHEIEQFVPGSDGIPEVNLYPQDTGSTANRGTVNIGASNNSTARVSHQILYGVSGEDLAYHGGELLIGELGLLLNGDPGISAGFKDELAIITGESRIVPVFSDMQGNGNNGVYTISEWAGVRFIEADLTGKNKRVIVQPSMISTRGVIPGSDDSSEHVYSRVWLIQ